METCEHGNPWDDCEACSNAPTTSDPFLLRKVSELPASLPALSKLVELRERTTPWYVRKAVSLNDSVSYFVTAVPPEHECWSEASLSAWGNVGVWTDHGLTTKEIAEEIVAAHNDLQKVLEKSEEQSATIERLRQLLRQQSTD